MRVLLRQALIKLTARGARARSEELLVRDEAADDERQVDFIPVETLLRLAASSLVN